MMWKISGLVWITLWIVVAGSAFGAAPSIDDAGERRIRCDQFPYNTIAAHCIAEQSHELRAVGRGVLMIAGDSSVSRMSAEPIRIGGAPRPHLATRLIRVP
jgi:hypothetical protein